MIYLYISTHTHTHTLQWYENNVSPHLAYTLYPTQRHTQYYRQYSWYIRRKRVQWNITIAMPMPTTSHRGSRERGCSCGRTLVCSCLSACCSLSVVARETTNTCNQYNTKGDKRVLRYAIKTQQHSLLLDIRGNIHSLSREYGRFMAQRLLALIDTHDNERPWKS